MQEMYKKIGELRNWSDNPRDIKKEKFEELKKRISRFGQIKPVLCTPDGEVLGGNMRLRAMRELGVEDVWVSIVEPKTEAEKVEIALTDNEEMGYYEDQALAELIEKYKEEIDLTMYSVHRNRIQTPIYNDHMNLEETSEFIYECFVNLRMILAEKSSYYITAPQGGDLLMMMMMMQKADLTLKHMLIWVKNNHVLGRTDYNYKHEPILFGWVNTHNFYGNGKHKFSTWEINRPLKSDLHPTMKPIELIVNAVENSTIKDEIVADLFLGSGSTLIACEQTNRICYGMELDPKYVDVIRKRYYKFTNDNNEDGWQEATPAIK